MEKVRLKISIALASLFLVLLTVMMMLWQHFGMNIELNLVKPGGTSEAALFMDEVNGGISRGRLSYDDGSIRLDCNIKRTNFTHPFCGLTVPVKSAKGSGINMDRYSDLELTVDYQTRHNDTLLVYLLNQEKSGAAPERSNMYPLNIIEGKSSYRIPISSFFVPSWWMYQHPDDKKHGRVMLDNVTALRITSGDNTQTRDAVIQLHRATLSGKIISKTELYFILIILWICVIFIMSLLALVHLYRSERREKEKNRRLNEMNSHLALEKQKLQEMIKTDPLTGAFNRAGLENELLDLRLADIEGKGIVSIIYLDIDHFKAVNDRHGHAKGDRILVELSQRIRHSIRHSDRLVRLGGEEFLVLCKHTTLQEAVLMAEKLRKAIADTPMSGINITCSFGVVECTSDQAKEAIDDADSQLYQAKETGRNKVCAPQRKQS